jgi:hypothetical protein
MEQSTANKPQWVTPRFLAILALVMVRSSSAIQDRIKSVADHGTVLFTTIDVSKNVKSRMENRCAFHLLD